MMRLNWLQLASGFGADSAILERTWTELHRRYQEPTRHYHNLRHLQQVLAEIQILSAKDKDRPVALDFAAWLHDVIYDSRAQDNEQRSADYAREMLSTLQVPAEIREETARLILLTRTHTPQAEDRSGCILVDADLAILGAAENDYQEYGAAIRREYSWVPESEYRAGRLAVLERFLSRPFLFHTVEKRAMAEQRARQNLQRECAALSRCT